MMQTKTARLCFVFEPSLFITLNPVSNSAGRIGEAFRGLTDDLAAKCEYGYG